MQADMSTRLILNPMYLESCRAVLETSHAISVKLRVLTLIRDTNMAAKHSIRD